VAIQSRLLLTTRFNQSYSNDNVIRISGFSLGEEFSAYLEVLRERIEFRKLSNSEVEKIHQVSNGSPLFTESLIRLLRWTSVNDAIASWKGDKGYAVRAAALKREIELLSIEAQRILLTIALLGEAATVELKDILGYPSEKVESGLEELLSLFLVAAPALALVPRFRIPDNTRRLVLDSATSLVTDRVRLERDVDNFKKRSSKTPTSDSRVASAIYQASAFVRAGDIDAALATIKDARKRTQDHCDLLSYEATLNMKLVTPNVEQARLLARKAFSKGCRKPEVYECWFEAEWIAKHFVGALEAADAALDNKCPGANDWLIRKSAALAGKASDQANARVVDSAVSTMFEASEVIRKAISLSSRDASIEWEAKQAEFHDQIWLWPDPNVEGLGKTVSQLDKLERMRQLGDYRPTNLRRILSTMEGMCLTLERKLSGLTGSQKNLCGTQILRAQTLLTRNVHIEQPKLQGIYSAWDVIRNRIEVAISQHENRASV